MRLFLTTAFTSALALPCAAEELHLSVEVPRLDVAEYHRPYVAVWMETPNGQAAANLAVWYDNDMANDEGATWLKDMRRWWRKIGRSEDLSVDGVSGPTRPPGQHDLTFNANDEKLAGLSAGTYDLVIEAAREVGGRELLRTSINWPPRVGESINLAGEHELGAITLIVKP